MPRATTPLGTLVPLLLVLTVVAPVGPPRLVSEAGAVEPASLWPVETGRSWVYEGTFFDFGTTHRFAGSLTFEGEKVLAGRTVQTLRDRFETSPLLRAPSPLGTSSALLHRLWKYRPELRDALEERFPPRMARGYSFWPFVFLGPARDDTGFLVTASRVGEWRGAIAGWSAIHVEAPVEVGTTFSLQLIPDFVDDVFLYGEIVAVDVSREAAGRSYEHCTVVDYAVDQGVLTVTDGQGVPVGTMELDVTGTVTYAEGVGPIALVESTVVSALDCPTCEFGLGDTLNSGELAVVEAGVGSERTTWSGLKARW